MYVCQPAKDEYTLHILVSQVQIDQLLLSENCSICFYITLQEDHSLLTGR